jgi:hypothetical protein
MCTQNYSTRSPPFLAKYVTDVPTICHEITPIDRGEAAPIVEKILGRSPLIAAGYQIISHQAFSPARKAL